MGMSPPCPAPRSAGYLLLGLVLLSTSLAVGEEPAQAIHRYRTDLGNVESSIRLLQSEYAQPVAQSLVYDLEKRFVDARVYYDLKHYDKASILLLDLVENPQFKRNSDYLDAVFLLAHCLYNQRNWVAARRYFEEVVTARTGAHYDPSVFYLIEIALDRDRLDDLPALGAIVARLGSSASDRVSYAWGKALYRQGKISESVKALSAIPPASPEYAPARYYLGVIYTGQRDFTNAIAFFREVMAIKEATDALGPVREEAALAAGRLSLEMGDIDRALEAYQSIDRRSPSFDVALYEMAWAYLARDRYEQALHTLDVLLLTVQDDQLAVDASILRARIQLEVDGADDAAEAYKEVVDRFTPIKNELESFSRSDTNLAKYFQWLLDRRADRYVASPPLSERAAKFVENVEAMEPVIRLFDDMAVEKADVAESFDVASSLEAALSASNRVEIFPSLENGWVRIMESENRLILLNRELLETENAFYLEHARGEDRSLAQQFAANRRALEERFLRSVPRTVADYRARSHRVNVRFEQLKKDAFLVEQTVKRVRDQLDAMDKILTDAKYSMAVAPAGAADKALIGELEAEKARLHGLYDELEAVQREIEVESTRIGAGDFVAEGETNIKNEILAAQKREHELYRRLAGSLPGPERGMADQMAGLRLQIRGDFDALGAVLARIQQKVDEKVGEYRKLVQIEKNHLTSYQAEEKGYEGDSRRVATDVGNALFRSAQEKVADVVLEADLGLLDIAWQQKQRKSDRISELTVEKNERLKQLQESLSSIIEDEESSQPAATPPPPTDDKPVDAEDEDDGEEHESDTEDGDE